MCPYCALASHGRPFFDAQCSSSYLIGCSTPALFHTLLHQRATDLAVSAQQGTAVARQPASAASRQLRAAPLHCLSLVHHRHACHKGVLRTQYSADQLSLLHAANDKLPAAAISVGPASAGLQGSKRLLLLPLSPHVKAGLHRCSWLPHMS